AERAWPLLFAEVCVDGIFRDIPQVAEEKRSYGFVRRGAELLDALDFAAAACGGREDDSQRGRFRDKPHVPVGEGGVGAAGVKRVPLVVRPVVVGGDREVLVVDDLAATAGRVGLGPSPVAAPLAVDRITI